MVSFLLTTKIAIFAHSKITMLDKLEAIKARFDQVGVALTNPEIINNQSEFGKYSKEYRSLEKIVIPYERYVKVLAEHKFAKESLNGDDADMRELAKMELPALDEEKEALKSGNITSDEVIEKLNTIRAGKSFKDEQIKSAMESYINDLDDAEKTALFAFLKGIAQIVGGEVEGKQATEPSDKPANVKMEKKPSSQKVTIKPNVIKKPSAGGEKPKEKASKSPEDTTPPAPIVAKKK